MPDHFSQPMPSPNRIAAPGHPTQPGAAESAGRLTRPDRLKLWPLEAGRYGLDATFHGHWGCEDAEQHAGWLARRGMASAIRPEGDGGWTVRLGPLNSLEAARALTYLVR